jgi:steroid delta-isomerase-like uncharacterized protein
MSTHDHRTVVHLYYEELWNRWRLELADELIASDVRFRGSLGVECRGREGFKDYVATVRRAFPDFRNTIEELIVGDGKAVARVSYTGTHRGELFGVASSGRAIGYSGVAIFDFDRSGRISRAWILGDTLALLRQLGARTLPETT